MFWAVVSLFNEILISSYAQEVEWTTVASYAQATAHYSDSTGIEKERKRIDGAKNLKN